MFWFKIAKFKAHFQGFLSETWLKTLGMFWQYKFHWDAELTHHNLDNDMARYVTALLYLTDVEAGGETLLPLADEGMEGLGCAGCEERPDLRASSRSQGHKISLVT